VTAKTIQMVGPRQADNIDMVARRVSLGRQLIPGKAIGQMTTFAGNHAYYSSGPMTAAAGRIGRGAAGNMMVAFDAGSVRVMQGVIKADPLVQVAQGIKHHHFGKGAVQLCGQRPSGTHRADHHPNTQTQQEPYPSHANLLWQPIFL
jgi:hypothetical protein